MGVPLGVPLRVSGFWGSLRDSAYQVVITEVVSSRIQDANQLSGLELRHSGAGVVADAKGR